MSIHQSHVVQVAAVRCLAKVRHGVLQLQVLVFGFFGFLVQGNVAQHLRSMRGYVNLCERRHVLGERICEVSVEKSY